MQSKNSIERVLEIIKDNPQGLMLSGVHRIFGFNNISSVSVSSALRILLSRQDISVKGGNVNKRVYVPFTGVKRYETIRKEEPAPRGKGIIEEYITSKCIKTPSGDILSAIDFYPGKNYAAFKI